MAPCLERGFRIGDCTVLPQHCRIECPEGEAHVEPRAMDVLLALSRRAGNIVTRDELVSTVWKHPNVSDEALSRCISLLRNVFHDDHARPRILETIPKRGYRLLAPVQAAAGSCPIEGTTYAVAVLPAANLSGRAADEHLADATTEILINGLVPLPCLRVTSRTSSMHYKGSHQRLTEIAAELGVDRIIEGSILVTGRGMQLAVRLIEPASDTNLLTRTYARSGPDAVREAAAIAPWIASEVCATLRAGARNRASHAPPTEDEEGG